MRSPEHILAELMHACRFYPSSAQVGQGSSTRPILINSSDQKQILNVHLPDVLPAGCDGMATVHLTVTENVPTAQLLEPLCNSKLLVQASWQSGRGGGDVEIDGSEGMILTVAANSSVVLTGRLVPSVEGAQMVIGSTYTAEAVTKWYTSAGGGPARLSLAARPIVGGVSAFFKVPALARNVTLHAVSNAAYATLFGELATVPVADAIRYATPNAPDRWPIVNGVEWIRARSAVDTLVFPSFELWC